MARSRSRSGVTNSFWNNTAAGANATSSIVELARAAEHLIIYVTTSAATTITVEVAHAGNVSSQGTWPEASGGSPVWHQLVTPATTAAPVQHVFAAAGSAAFIISDFPARAIRLKTSGAATLTAGHETVGD